MTRVFWHWGAVLCDFYNMSQANDFDIFGTSKTVFSYYIAILYQYYCSEGFYILPIYQTVIKNWQNLFNHGCFITWENPITMSQANTRHYEEMVQNNFCWNFLANALSKLKQRPMLEFLGPIGYFGGSFNHFEQQIVLAIRKNAKKIGCDSKQ